MRFGQVGRSLVGALAITLAVSACSPSGKQPSGAGALEKTTLTVGYVPVPDAAPLFIAQKHGFFREEGLTVKPQVLQASPEAVAKLNNGSMDFALLNYAATFVAQDKNQGRFKLVTDSYQGGPKSFALLVRPDSRITSPRQLKGKRVAVAAPKSITHLLLTQSLAVYGLKEKDVKPVAMKIPDMADALKQRKVDAIGSVEPFVTSAESELGARILLDLVSGPTSEFPIAGWGTIEDYVKKNPNTVAAFQRAMGKASRLAATRADEVTKVIPTYTDIPPGTASIIALGSFPISLNYPRMQRVADTLHRFNYTQRKIDARQLMLPPPPPAE